MLLGIKKKFSHRGKFEKNTFEIIYYFFLSNNYRNIIRYIKLQGLLNDILHKYSIFAAMAPIQGFIIVTKYTS